MSTQTSWYEQNRSHEFRHVPVEFVPVVDSEPGNFAVLCGIADYWTESERHDLAAAFQWIVSKERAPRFANAANNYLGFDHPSLKNLWHWRNDAYSHGVETLPAVVYYAGGISAHGDKTVSEAYCRLVHALTHLSKIHREGIGLDLPTVLREG